MSTNNEALEQVLEYGCSDWRMSSQRAANAYRAGIKLWRKPDLLDIEQQLSDSVNREYFTVRTIFGKTMKIINPGFRENTPIWKPFVKFQEYWRLVKAQPDGPTSTYHCSYLVEWANQTARDFRRIIDNPSSVFMETRSSWIESKSCDLLKTQLSMLLTTRKVTKVICFGLGDMCREPPEWFRRQSDQTDEELMRSFVRPSMVQHSIALSVAEISSKTSRNEVQLLAQDPDYSEQAKEVLVKAGFSIVGQFGAGGFAEIDTDTVVVSAFIEAPLKQIVADIARPVLLISTGRDTFNGSEKPWADAESPRTLSMWEDYDMMRFPVSRQENEAVGTMSNLYMYVRKADKS